MQWLSGPCYKDSQMKYRAEIDGLRALAVIPVILFHAGFELFSGGYVGVDVFFVISGYLITSILVEDIEKDRFSLIRFYDRRARRILPALFLVMACCIPFALMWMLPNEIKNFWQSIVAVTLFASNILFWRESGYFDTAVEEKPLLHTWSLAVEEQYYVLFPIFLLLAWRFGKNRVFWIIVGLSAVSLLFSEWGSRHSKTANFYLATSRAWELLAGSMAAFIIKKRGVQKNEFLSIIGLFGILYATFAYDKNTPFPSLYALIPIIGVVLLILFSHKDTFVAKLLSLKVFVGIGLISYSAYLWHQPLFAFTRIRLFETPSGSIMLALSATSIGLAYMSWRFVEQPFRRRSGSETGQMKSLLLSAAIASLFLGVGLSGHYGKGLKPHVTKSEQELIATASRSPLRERCHVEKTIPPPKESCVIFGGQPTVAVYGNSHGVELSYALAEELKKNNKSVMQFTISGCPATFQRNALEHCTSFYQDRLKFILETESLNDVIIAYRAEKGGKEAALSIMNLANYFSDHGKNVTLVIQAPTLPRHISKYIRHVAAKNLQAIPARPRKDWMKINSAVYNIIEGLNDTIKVVDLADAYCDISNCYAILNGEALYFDDNHISLHGARMSAKSILEDDTLQFIGTDDYD